MTLKKNEQNHLSLPFDCLTEEELRQWYEDKLIATPGYLLVIRKITESTGTEFTIPNVLEFCKKWRMSKSAFYRAVNELKQKGYTVWDITEFSDIERRIRDRLGAELGGQVEVITAVGRIDLLTASEVIEIKNIDDWKEALGKILAYSAFFPEHCKRIHLFGKLNLTKLALAQALSSEFNISVTFEEVQ